MKPAWNWGGGGDYYDILEFPDNRVGFMIADASGHGPSAACIMAITRAYFRDLALQIVEPGKVLEAINNKVDGNYPRGNFVTMFYCVLDLNTGEVVSANSAHPYPLFGQKGKFQQLEGPTGMILGMFPSQYPEARHQLKPGDHLILFTDGIEEHKDENRVEFGYEGITPVLEAFGDQQPQVLIDELVKAADAFRPTLPREDDFTFVCLRWRP
ncbi:PP2C family protein-serine/threonine phosphatase [Deltaproteobacteria bacterium TL4]